VWTRISRLSETRRKLCWYCFFVVQSSTRIDEKEAVPLCIVEYRFLLFRDNSGASQVWSEPGLVTIPSWTKKKERGVVERYHLIRVYRTKEFRFWECSHWEESSKRREREKVRVASALISLSLEERSINARPQKKRFECLFVVNSTNFISLERQENPRFCREADSRAPLTLSRGCYNTI